MSTLVVDDNDVTDGLRNKKAASMTNEFASVKSLSNDDESIIIDDAHARSSGIIIRRRAALHIELLESSHNEDVPITLQEYDIDFDDQINETTNLLKPLSIEDKSHHHHESTRVLPKEQSKHGGSSSSMATSIFNLVNNVAGAGLLTLSGGQASGNGTGWIPAILISTILGFIAAVTFIMIGTSCELMKEYNFKVCNDGVKNGRIKDETNE